MTRPGLILAALAALGAAGGGGYYLGRGATALRAAVPTAQAATPSTVNRTISYYQDPDGKPFYSAEPKKTGDGRDYVAVYEEGAAPSPQAGAKTGDAKKILYYRNPMGLADTSPVPKKDSMGMDYLPVYEGEDADDGSVKIGLGKLQRTGVRSESAERRMLSAPLRAPGTIQPDERRVSVLALRAEGFVEHVENVTTGDRVKKGQPLVQIYSHEFAAASALYLSSLGLDGARRRLENLAVPDAVIAEMERTHKAPHMIAWPAPRDGVVLERNAVDGMRAMPGDVLFRVADLSTVWAQVDIAERDLPMVAIGEKVRVTPRGYPDRAFEGRVALIYPQINKETRTARVRVELANPDGLLRPEMYVEAEIETGAGGPVLAVPSSAIIDSGARQVVIVDKGEGRFEPRPVKLGRGADGFTEIREGVQEGEDVVVAANFLIDAESNLKAALRGLDVQEAKP